MSKPINIYEAKSQFSRLVDRASKGESFVIAKSGTPVARLGPLEEPKRRIKFGLMKGEFEVPEDFDAPLADDLLDDFYRGDPG